MRRKSKTLNDSAAKKACPIYDISVSHYDDGDGDNTTSFTASVLSKKSPGKRESIGELLVYLKFFGPRLNPKPKFQVASIRVDSALQRCGVGTKLYEAAAKYGCEKFKTPLNSDDIRSIDSHTFWKKQESKGRATCVRPTSDGYTGDQPHPKYGRGGCEYYKLTCPVPETLSKRKRRR